MGRAAQLVGVTKRLLSTTSISQSRSHNYSFLDTVRFSQWPAEPVQDYNVFFKTSLLKGATQEEKMAFYIKNASLVFGSEEEAKEMINKITRDCSFCAFGAEMSMDALRKFSDLPAVDYVDEDSTGKAFFIS